MKLRWGIFSAGRISSDFALALNTLDRNEHEIFAVAARSFEHANCFATKLHATKSYGSYEELCKDKDVDVVYIGSINTTHKDLSILALNHGKHVLCEKPITMNSSELEEVLKIAKEKKLFFMEAMWTRFFPLYRQLVKNISDGKIGKPSTAMVSFGYAALMDNRRVVTRDVGGSPLLDIGVYTLNFADIVFDGETPERVVAVGHLLDNGLDHTVSITLLYKDKRTAQLLISCGCDLPNDAVVIGNKGRCVVKAGFNCPTEVTYYVGSKTESEAFPLPNTEFPTSFNNSAGLRYEAMHVRECIMAKKVESEIMPHETSRRMMKLMDDVRKQLGIIFDADK